MPRRRLLFALTCTPAERPSSSADSKRQIQITSGRTLVTVRREEHYGWENVWEKRKNDCISLGPVEPVTLAKERGQKSVTCGAHQRLLRAAMRSKPEHIQSDYSPPYGWGMGELFSTGGSFSKRNVRSPQQVRTGDWGICVSADQGRSEARGSRLPGASHVGHWGRPVGDVCEYFGFGLVGFGSLSRSAMSAFVTCYLLRPASLAQSMCFTARELMCKRPLICALIFFFQSLQIRLQRLNVPG